MSARQTPEPHIYGPAYVESMQAKLDSSEMKEALSQLSVTR